MNKKILILVLLQVCLFAAKSFAQCTTSVGCIQNQHVNGSTNWYASHGAPSFPANNAPTSTGNCISMWSYLNMGSGAFTEYNFVQGNTYRVCFWVRNNSGWPGNPFGRLYVYAACNLSNNTTGYPVTPPSVGRQLIDQSYYGPPQGMVSPSTGATAWEFVSATFTAQANFNNLWLYPLNPEGPPPPGPVQYNLDYIVEVDDIRVEDLTTNPAPTLSVSGNNTINGCNDQTTLTINGMPAGYDAVWTPAVSTPNPTGSVVVAAPCSTTTYKIEVTDPASTCGTCVKEVLYYTVNVNQWSDATNLVYPTAPIPCTTNFNLDYNDPLTCPGVTYQWLDPQAVPTPPVPSTTALQTFTANASHTGEWTLKIFMPGKSCAEEIKFNITVGSCCISNPNFTFTPNTNPIYFTNISTGITNHVGTLWSFGDGTTSDQDNPIHSYAAAGPYTVCLTMLFEDGQGESCCNRICQTVVAGPNNNNCVVFANWDYVHVNGWGNTFDFIDGSTGNGTICNYYWDFGDGNTLNTTVPTVRHSYSTPGPWYACLTVTNCIYDPNTGALLNTCTDQKCYWIPQPMLSKPDLSNNARQTRPQTEVFTFPPVAKGNKTTTENGLTVYPNPNAGNFILSLLTRTGAYQVVVRDNLGREVYNNKHTFGSEAVKIALNDVAAGIYSVEVMNDREKFVQQMSITR